MPFFLLVGLLKDFRRQLFVNFRVPGDGESLAIPTFPELVISALTNLQSPFGFQFLYQFFLFHACPIEKLHYYIRVYLITIVFYTRVWKLLIPNRADTQVRPYGHMRFKRLDG